ncbi:XrtA/PEP-CTERM system histidine kinase PrsK [Erythrobacter rubeus]|uniref:histidine kinase n=1 Tax=Erythrobacter rubeus TaxID=2760803 RepID=A0ABR8KR16_9SPHN|nr:XrtA/PEP-CTERM system histidine kinase PrsK [Erythrobacter rubeus]MBD2841995.1 PEP-CTERM system histidine kinase PrsK [Erythrobacter rubeus]
MIDDPAGLKLYVSIACYIAGAVVSSGAAVWIMRFGDGARRDRLPLIAACLTTATWCGIAAAFGPLQPIAVLAETGRNLAFIALIFRLFSADGCDESLKPIRPVVIALALVQLFQPVLLFMQLRVGFVPEIAALTFEAAAILNMLVAVGALLLVHNLYAGAGAASRQVLRWSAAALAAIFAYDLNLFTTAYLLGEYPEYLVAARGLFVGAMAGGLVVGGTAASAELQFRPSRSVTFQTLSLLFISSYLLIMTLVTRSLTLLGGDFARAGQILFLMLGIGIATVLLASKGVRGWLRVTATKHLFQHRYDYREEWLRFTATIGRGADNSASFHERAVKAIADIADSPAGLLLVANEEASLELTARWNWATIEVPAIAGDYGLSGFLEKHGHIIDMGEVRTGIEHRGELAHIPDWMTQEEDIWALVPLIHFDRLVGAIVLARPRIERRLDWEDFDLLRVVGQQLASYLAEQAGQQALMDASRFDEFNRRMAFVMHDIKNLASQLSLLSANAQKHADNPAFRKDMLVTLRNSSEKLSALLARLGRYGAGPVQELSELELGEFGRSLAARFKPVHPVIFNQTQTVRVMADPETLEQAVVHLVQNAIDASAPNSPVYISASHEGLNGQIDIVDAGHGMTPEFVRSGLFKPFVSSKDGGFGIGAFEAREMIKALGGRLMVESREGVGTRFRVILPVAETHRLSYNSSASKSPPKEVANG